MLATFSSVMAQADSDFDLEAFLFNDSLFMEINSSSSSSDDFNIEMENDTSMSQDTNLSQWLNLTLTNDTIKLNAIRTTEELWMFIKMIVMSIVLFFIILITIIGNVFVIAAIILERNLQNVANYLVASLAVADLLVACLVMPLGAVYEISDGWILGPELCDIWTSCDVLCCTASILHLVAIAADRYWTVTNIDYNNLRTPRRVFSMIFCVWFAGLIVSLAPQFGWKDPDYMKRIEEETCMVSQDVAYQIFATCCTFYVPLLVILFLYWKIYKIARKRIQRRTQKTFAVTVNETTDCDSTTPQPSSNKEKSWQRGGQPDEQQPLEQQRRKRKRLKICFSAATAAAAAGASAEVASKVATLGDKKCTLGVNIETITTDFASLAITREETEFSTSNYDNKSHAGTECTTVSSDAEDFRTASASEILTLSHQVATAAHQQQLIATHLNVITPYSRTGGVGGAGGNAVNLAANRTTVAGSTIASIVNPHQKIAKRRQLLEAKRERKAAQTLAIITGAFVVSWLPFFVMALTLSLCKNCSIPPAIASLFLWLGYFNSTLNPIIYTIFNPEFRRVFQRILYGRKNAARARSAKI